MNILILSDIETAGEWIATQNLLAELKKRNDINLYLVAFGKKTFLLNKKLFKAFMLTEEPPLVPPFRYYRQIILEFLSGLFSLKKVAKKEEKFDTIIFTEYRFFLPALIIFPLIKKIFWFHGFRNNYKLTLKHFNFYIFLIKFLERLAWFLSSIIMVPSKWSKKVIENELGIFSKVKKIIIVLNVIPSCFKVSYKSSSLVKFRNRYCLPDKKKFVLYSGRIDIVKGLENLLQTIIFLNNKYKDLALIIAYVDLKTDKELLKKLISFVQLNRLNNYVFFLKDLPIKELAKLYQLSECAVLPSSIEMGSLFLLEALYSGLPVFSTPVGNAKELLRGELSSIFILRDNSMKGIQSALNNFFLKSSIWRIEMRKKIRSVAEKKLSTEISIKEFQKLLY